MQKTIEDSLRIVVVIVMVIIAVVIFIAATRTTFQSLTPEAAQAQTTLSLDELSPDLTLEALRNICNASRDFNLARSQCNLWAALVFYLEQQEPR